MMRNLKVVIPTFRTMGIAKATVMVKVTMMEVRVGMKAMAVGGISVKKLKSLMVNVVQIALRLQRKPGRRLPPRVIDKRKGRGRLEDEKALDKGWQKNIYLVSQIHQLVVTDC